MSNIRINHDKCNLCTLCTDICPFNAIVQKGNRMTINAACKLCKICVKQCPKNAIIFDTKKLNINKNNWQGYLVFVEFVESKIHPVAIELIGIAKKLSVKTPMPVYAVIIGSSTKKVPEKLLEYGVNEVFVYDHDQLSAFAADSYTNVLEDLIHNLKPSVVLIGGTSIGRSLAPKIATRFKTGLTADCTTLEIKENTDLVQIRPAFGGNIMAQIVTPNTRPQFATVRYKVMDRAQKTAPIGKITHQNVTDQMIKSDISVLSIIKKDSLPSITDAEVLIVAGRGIKNLNDLCMIKELASILGGDYACTRPLVENGWCDYTRQIGISGRTVKPKLIITCGVSGAIQFTTCMDAAEYIVAINTDKKAPVLDIAHVGIVGDLYEIIPSLIEKLKGANEYAI